MVSLHRGIEVVRQMGHKEDLDEEGVLRGSGIRHDCATVEWSHGPQSAAKGVLRKYSIRSNTLNPFESPIQSTYPFHRCPS